MNSPGGVSAYRMTNPTKSTGSIARAARAASPSFVVCAAATSINDSCPVPTSPTDVAIPEFANDVRLPAEKLPSVAGGSASSRTTGTTIAPSTQASRVVIADGDGTRAEARRPRAAAVSKIAPVGTTHEVLDDR
jgi:hypothetical protein